MNGVSNGRVLLAAVAWGGVTLLNVALLPRRYAPRVETERVDKAPLRLVVQTVGYLDAKESSLIRAQFDGPVVSKSFREGQTVRKGETLMVLSRERIRLDYQARRDALRNAQSDLSDARRDLRLQMSLYDREAVAYSAVTDAQKKVVLAEQALAAAKEGLTMSQKVWNSAEVRAPLAGTIVKDWIGDEKTVAAGKELVTVADVSEYTVHGKVDEIDIKNVHEGQKADVRIQIYPQNVFHAVVSQIGAASDPNTPDVPIVLTLDSGADVLLRPKLTAEARIHRGQTEPVLSVPLSAIANADGVSRVWTIDRFYKLRARRVELGRSNPDRVEVVKGLQVGEVVCRTADQRFSEGLRILLGDVSPGKHP